jgi:hypothetical protein
MNSRMIRIARIASAGLLALTVVTPAAGQKKYGLDLGWKTETPAPAPPKPKAVAIVATASPTTKPVQPVVSTPAPPETKTTEGSALVVLAESMARLVTRVEELVQRVNRIETAPVQIASAAPTVVEEKAPMPVPGPVPAPPAPEVSPVAHKSTIVRKTGTPRVEFQNITLSSRYRYVENSKGLVTNNQLQSGLTMKFRSRIDAAGKLTVNAGLFTGGSFTSGWNNSGAGTGDLVTNLYLKHLWVEAKPFEGVQLQVGSLAIQRGESTEITSYDNDGYITGERLSLKQPKLFWFDEVAVTYGHLGDLNTPQAYRRLNRLAESNYHQFFAARKVGRVSFSADYTFHSGVETLREAGKIDTTGTGIADSIQFEAYQRLDKKPASGFAVFGERSFTKRIKAGIGYATLDPDSGGLNGDKFNRGNRAYMTSTFVLTPQLSVATFVQQAVGNGFPVSNRQRVDIQLNYNLLKRLQTSKIPGFTIR